jgi:hypothetical protein
MNVYELLEKVGGEIVRGKARVRQGDEYIILGIPNGDDMIFTPEGTAMARELEGAKKGGKKAKTVVETPAEIIEIEDTLVVEEAVAADPADDELADLLAAVEDK